MTKAQSPLVGFNNNVRHRGRVFHIQTEDSGVKYPHVITHLFANGGRILKSLKTSYAEFLGSENLQETVRNLMKDQHKAMFIALRDGQLDALMDEGPNKDAAKVGSGPTQTAAPIPVDKPSKESSDLQPRSRQPSHVDLDVLERAAAAVQSGSPLFGVEDMPPPPPAVLSNRKPSGSYRALGSESQSPDPVGQAENSRYSATRPASIFGTSGPSETTGSVFGEDMISGKSLDEVILGFLAEEFGTLPSKDDNDDDSGKDK